MLQIIDRSATAINPDLENSDLQSRGRECKGLQECAINSKEKGEQCAQRSGGRPRRNFDEVSFSQLRLTASYTEHAVPVSRFRYLSPRDYRTPGEDLDSARSVWPNEILIFDKAHPRPLSRPFPLLSSPSRDPSNLRRFRDIKYRWERGAAARRNFAKRPHGQPL